MKAKTVSVKGPRQSPYFQNKNTREKSEPITDGVQDNIDYDLRVLFVGINPGLASTAKGHHFAGPTNHFWPCLSSSGLVNEPLTYLDDIHLPSKYRLGITNLTARTSRKASDLSLEEQRAGIPTLTAKFSKYRPRVACFVGKGIYEIYTGEKCKQMGLQSRTVAWDNGQGATKLFVMPSTSGIVSAYQKSDKLRFFRQLCEIANASEGIEQLGKTPAKDI